MTKDTSLENDGKPNSSSDGNDLEAKYEALKAEVAAKDSEIKTLTQQRNLFRNQAAERTTELEKVTKAKDDVASEFQTFRDEAEKKEKDAAVKGKESEILDSYPEKVKQLAKDLGISLTDAEDADEQKAFTDKLDKLKAGAGAEGEGSGDDTPPPPVTSHNGRSDGDTKLTEEQQIELEEEKLKDVKF